MSEKPYAMHVVSTKSVLEHQKSDMSLADLARFIKQGEGVELIPLCGNYGDNNGESVFFEAGDFCSSMSLSMLESAGIVISNPPFSLIKAYIMQLDAFKNEFLIVGNKNAITYKGIFPLFMQDKIWLGEGSMNGGRWMMVPDGIELISQHYKRDAEGKRLINIPGVCWFTNLDHKKRHQQLPLDLNCTYLGHEELYPKYDNYDAIEVDRVSRIPHDYNGVMGVPITFLDKYCPTQFKIVGASESEGVGLSNGLWDSSSKISQPVVYGKRKYKRLFIERC